MCTVVRFTQSLILLRTGVDLRRHSRFRRVSSFSHYNDLADRQHYSANAVLMTSTGTVRYLTHADSTVDPLASIRAQKLPA